MFTQYVFTCNFWADWDAETGFCTHQWAMYLGQRESPCTRRWRVQHELLRHYMRHAAFWSVWSQAPAAVRGPFSDVSANTSMEQEQCAACGEVGCVMWPNCVVSLAECLTDAWSAAECLTDL